MRAPGLPVICTGMSKPKPVNRIARIELRCLESERRRFLAASEREGDRSMTAWIMRHARLALREVAETVRSIRAAVPVVR